eukprot:8253665-Alexandrium_andersonii.AAC.1
MVPSRQAGDMGERTTAGAVEPSCTTRGVGARRRQYMLERNGCSEGHTQMRLDGPAARRRASGLRRH